MNVRNVWNFYADLNADGAIDSGDIQVGHEECVAREWPDLIGVRLASVSVGAGWHVLKVKCIVDCVPPAVIGSPTLSAQLRLEVIPDSYGN